MPSVGTCVPGIRHHGFAQFLICHSNTLDAEHIFGPMPIRLLDLLINTYTKRGSSLCFTFGTIGRGMYAGCHIVQCRGFWLSTIGWLGEPSTGGVIPVSWRDGLTKCKFQKSWMEQTYWRVLVADRDPEGKHPPTWYRRACNELFEKRKHADLDTVQLLRSEEDKGSSISSLTAKFLRRVQTTVWSRRLVILKNDCIGLVPQDTIETDTICILFGCDVPVVFRKHERW